MINIKELKERLNADAERVCRHLLPHGKRLGRRWICGDVHGAAGDSTIVELEGSKVGVWADFANGGETEKGDLLDLWEVVHKIDNRKAFRAAKEFLGIRNPNSSATPKKTYAGKPDRKGFKKMETPEGDPVKKYLIERGISEEAIKAFKIAAKPDHDGVGGTDIVFPIYDPDGELINMKFCGLERTWLPDKNKFKKHIHQVKEAPPGLFGWQAFELESRVAIITEGEIDAMTWWDWGYRCVLSIPCGVGDADWIDWDWDNLEIFETIYLCFDTDKAGTDAAINIAKRLGLHRCRIISLPHKDPNECLKNGATVDSARVWLDESKYVEMPEIKTPDDYRELIHRYFDPPSDNDEELGLKTPIYGKRLRFRPGEMTLWSGHTSHGKSTLLNQIMIYAMMAGQRVAIGSFEVKGVATLAKLIMCSLLNDKPTHEDREEMLKWMTGKLWLFDFIGFIKKPHLLEMMKYAVMRHAANHFVIDSIMKCDLNSEDYEAQRQFINELHCFCHEHNVHIHLVGHPRKGKDDDAPPGIMDVNGGQSIVGQPDNMVVVWRNKAKEREREEGKMSDYQSNKTPDTITFVNKQRLTGEEFLQKLWFNRKCHRFATHYGDGEPKYEDLGIVQPKPPIDPAI